MNDIFIAWSEEDQEFVATTSRYPSLSWLASTATEAEQGLVDLIRAVEADTTRKAEQ